MAKLGENGEREAAAAKLQAKVLEEVLCEGHAVPHTLYINYCVTYSVCRQVVF
jgi:hypothetical protein